MLRSILTLFPMLLAIVAAGGTGCSKSTTAGADEDGGGGDAAKADASTAAPDARSAAPDASTDAHTPDLDPCPDGQRHYSTGCEPVPEEEGIRPLPGAGCYVPCGGLEDGDCPDGTRCDRTWIDPCGGPSEGEGSCAACGAEQRLCLSEERTVFEDPCARTLDHECETDADCTIGGCGDELCYNPDNEVAASTCDCMTPPADCGCVDGTCAWYE